MTERNAKLVKKFVLREFPGETTEAQVSRRVHLKNICGALESMNHRVRGRNLCTMRRKLGAKPTT